MVPANRNCPETARTVCYEGKLARLGSVSLRNLKRQFHNIGLRTPGEWLLEVRILRGLELLRPPPSAVRMLTRRNLAAFCRVLVSGCAPRWRVSPANMDMRCRPLEKPSSPPSQRAAEGPRSTAYIVPLTTAE